MTPMRFRRPRGLLAKQLAAHLLTLLVVGAVWAASGIHFLGRINHANDARFAASRLRQRILDARIAAQTFLARDVQDARFYVGMPLPAMEDFSRAMSESETRIAELERLRPEDTATVERLRALLDRYQSTFSRLTELYRRQGFADWGLEGEWRKSIQDVEAATAGKMEMRLDLLEMRRREKDYLLQRDPRFHQQVIEHVARLRTAADRLPGPLAARVRQGLDRYRQAFEEYVSIDREIGLGEGAGLRAQMAATVASSEPVVRLVYDDAQRAAQDTRRAQRAVSALILLGGLLLGGLVAYVFSRSISRPIEELQRAAQSMGGGRFDVPVPVGGDDEVADLGRALATMAKDLEHSWQSVRETHSLLSAVMDGATDAIVIKDLAGRYLVVNAAGARFMGRPLDQIVGRTDTELFSAEMTQAIAESDKRVLDSGETQTYEIEGNADGVRRTYLSTKGLLRDAQGRATGFFGISRDISERKRAEEATAQARDAAETASRAKSAFLANMSHEIRTPMNAVIGMTELLLGTELRSEQREYAVTVRESAKGLLAILDDVLDFSKVEADRVELREAPFTVEDVVSGAARTLALKAHEKGLELAFRIDPEVPAALSGDAGRLRQVLVNLVGNAVKFTERGEVLVSVDAPERTEADVLVRFRVADTGIGVAPEKRQTIFEPFVQEDGSTTRRFGGTGLGLAISARLIALMRGQIDVDALAGGGSVFTFTARLRLVPQPVPRPSTAELEGRAALVVDDNGTSRRILAERLTRWGLRPTVAGSAEAARQALAQARDAGTPFAVALLDADLGGPTARERGLEQTFTLAAQMRAEGGLYGPIVMMLAPDGSGSERWREQGLGASLTKPIAPSALFETLHAALGAQAAPAPATAPPAPPAASKAARPMHVLVAEDNAVNQRLILRVLEGRGHTVRLTGNGREALEVFQRDGPFDAVILDVQMPIMDGLEATAALRELEQASDRRTPIIALTAHALREDRERCLAAGADAYVAKPIRFEELFAQLENASAVFDRGKALALAARGDEAILREVADVFTNEASRTVADVRRAFESGDLGYVAQKAHALKGSASHFHAPAAVRALAVLETAARDGDGGAVGRALLAAEGEVSRLCAALSSSLQLR
jgi:two-component system sensor histidine kinase/response regulator